MDAHNNKNKKIKPKPISTTNISQQNEYKHQLSSVIYTPTPTTSNLPYNTPSAVAKQSFHHLSQRAEHSFINNNKIDLSKGFPVLDDQKQFIDVICEEPEKTSPTDTHSNTDHIAHIIVPDDNDEDINDDDHSADQKQQSMDVDNLKIDVEMVCIHCILHILLIKTNNLCRVVILKNAQNPKHPV